MCLLAHYRSALDFSLELLNAAKNGYEALKNKIKLIDEKIPGNDGENAIRVVCCHNFKKRLGQKLIAGTNMANDGP